MISNRIQEIRKKLHLSQEEISTQIGISYRAYTSYERGDRKPSIEFLNKMFNQFNVNLNYLISGKGEMFNKIEPSDDELTDKIRKVLREEGVIS